MRNPFKHRDGNWDGPTLACGELVGTAFAVIVGVGGLVGGVALYLFG